MGRLKAKQILKYAEELKKIAKLPLRYFGDPVLREKCREVSIKEIESKKVKEIANKLIRIIKKYRKITGVGRGLAAPQIGEKKRIIAVWGFGEESPRIMINPKIIWRSKKLAGYLEGCISSLDIMINVVRPYKVKIEYFDLKGKKYQEKLDSQYSRLLQHEIDHLDGILHTDRGDPKTIKIVFDIKNAVAQGKFKLVKIKDVK